MGILQKNYKYNNISQFIFEGGFTLLLIVYLTRLYLDTTMWYLGWSDRNSMLFALLAGFCVLLKCIFYDIWTIKEALAGIAIVFICGMVYHHTGYVDVLHFCVLVIGCKGVSDKTIVRLYFYVNMYLLCLTTIAMFIGIVPELIYYKDWEYIRRSFGSIYPTDLAAHIFFLIMAYSYIKKDQLRYLHLITFLLIPFCITHIGTVMYAI